MAGMSDDARNHSPELILIRMSNITIIWLVASSAILIALKNVLLKKGAAEESWLYVALAIAADLSPESSLIC